MSITFWRVGRGCCWPAPWLRRSAPLALVGLLQGVSGSAAPAPSPGWRSRAAVITSIDTTSSRAGSNPVMIRGLTIDGHPRRHRVLVPIHLVGALRPGAALPVRVDPADPRPPVVDRAAVR